MERVQIFCGSSSGLDQIFTSQVENLAEYLVERKIGVVYGGAAVGLMGILANKVLELGGEVIGVIPEFLQAKEIAHNGLSNLIIVESLQDRKIKMEEISDGTIALPGGFGTLDELFEMLTLAQLGIHKNPIGLLNINGFYDDLSNLLLKMTQSGLLKDVNRKMLLVGESVEDLIQKMENYLPPTEDKWIHNSK